MDVARQQKRSGNDSLNSDNEQIRDREVYQWVI